ncbi:paralemmin-3 [Gadus macrocephalus]|uniref:paralemmin-3 n=1 Tax=Gadus macrocephalus TaxID=80720 RepID=UPI0028CB3EA7|nr:paralemmin-3 [Gadus macrocephalus]XP_059902968.1 paralemmin-3 [Gadus macrocephalus]XP_059902969.1 paralemmin-3 [Gadus macrocephalus]
MDETEKYQQRLQAIAEKRRMQEEQEQAKRDMEDERLRLQQLKRKSLRDQWLMEGPPSSPTTPTSPSTKDSPHSPLWGPHTPETEKRIDELQEESRRLAQGELLDEQTEDGRTDTVNAAEATEDVLQNGQEKPTGSDAIEDEVTKSLSSLLDETEAVLTNGSTGEAVQTNPSPLEINTSTSGTTAPAVVTDGSLATALLGYVHTEPGLASAGRGVDDEDEDILVMRAERVIVLTDEDVPPLDQEKEEEEEEQQQEEVKEEESVPLDAAQGEAEGETMAQVEAAPLDTSAVTPHGEQCERSEGLVTVTAEADDSSADAQMTGDAISNKEEGKGAADDASIAPNSDPSLQSAAGAPDDPAVASVPTYSQGPASPRLGPGGETGTEAGAPAAAPGDGASELATPAKPPTPLTSHFQDVPLSAPQGTGAQPGEQDPLLGKAKAPQMKAGGSSFVEARRGPSSNAEAHAPASTNSCGAEEGVSPKHKTCQCCSVM